jgi:hypothetical protein
MNPLAKLPYSFGRTEALQPSCGSFLTNPCIQQFLRMCYDCLNKATLYRGETYWFVPDTVTADGIYGTDKEKTPYDKLKSEAEAAYNKELKESIDKVKKSFTDTDAWFATMYFTKVFNASGVKYIRRENNGVYAHCQFEIREQYPVFYVKSGFPYNAKIHAVSNVEDLATKTTNEYGVTELSENAETGWGTIGKNVLLNVVPKVTAGESYWLTDTKQRPINYPHHDVALPPDNTEGWETYAQRMKAEIHFCLDLNCEGGFKFRQDAE